MITQTLAGLVKSKRDAALAQKIERENARKKKCVKIVNGLLLRKKKRKLPALNEKEKKIHEAIAKREAEASKRKAIKSILSQCLKIAIEEKSKIIFNADYLSHRSDFEALGFTFFDQTEYTHDIVRLTTVREDLASRLERLNSDLETADSKLEEYLENDDIPTRNAKNNRAQVTRRPIYSFRDGLEVLQELIFRRDELQLTIDKWADVRKLSPWKIKETHPEIGHLTDALVLKTIDQRLLLAQSKYHELLEWESENINLVNELNKFNKQTVSLLTEHDLVELK